MALRKLVDDIEPLWLLSGPSRSSTIAVAVFLALAVALGFSVLSLAPEASLGFAGGGAPLRLDAFRDAGWGPEMPALVESAVLQRGAFAGLLSILTTLALLGVTIAGLAVAALLRLRRLRQADELTIHSAVGAAPRDLRRLRGIETIGFAVAGVGSGLLIGLLAYRALLASWPHRLGAEAFTGRAVGIALAIGLGVVLLAQLTMGHTRIAPTRRQTGSRPRAGLWICAAQLAGSAALLIAAALVLRSTGTLLEGAGGFDPDEAGVWELVLTGENRDAADRAERIASVLRRVGSVPGVRAESLSTPGAWAGFGPVGIATARCGRCSRGGLVLPLVPVLARHTAVSPGFFQALGIPVLEGREFSQRDRRDAEPVAIVSRSLAREGFEGGRALGRRIRLGARGPWLRVVGVVDDQPALGVGAAAMPAGALYVPLLQHPSRSVDLIVPGGPERRALDHRVTRSLRALEPGLARASIASLPARTRHQLAPLRWFGRVLGIVGGVILLMAAYGVFAAYHHEVDRRRREFGLRRALGARKRQISALVLRDALIQAAIAGSIGAWAAVGLAGLLQSAVPGIALFDPLVYPGVLLILLLMAGLGALSPAARAARLPPMQAIRASLE